jgi:hypothetical protein
MSSLSPSREVSEAMQQMLIERAKLVECSTGFVQHVHGTCSDTLCGYHDWCHAHT